MSYTGTTPQFDSVEGGNIKVDGNSIISTNEDGNIDLVPSGTGKVTVETMEPRDISKAVASTEYVDSAVDVLDEDLQGQIDVIAVAVENIEDALGDLATGAFLEKDGSVAMTGNLDLGGNRIIQVASPVDASDAVNKFYADGLSGGVVTRPSVKAATTVALGGTYDNGALDDGVGATLNLGPLTTLDIDDIIEWSLFDGILVKDQAASLQNGRYFVSQVGDDVTDWILTRCGTCDQSSEIPASYMFVEFGTVNQGKGFVAIVGTSQGANPNVFEIGYDSITFTQFTGGQAYLPGAALELDNQTFNVKVDGTTIEVNGNNELTVIGGGGGGGGEPFLSPIEIVTTSPKTLLSGDNGKLLLVNT